MIKTAVIGHGFSAKTFHLPFLTSLADFQVSAISSSQGDAVAANYPDATIYPTAEDLILKSDAELVVITSPNVTHFPLAKLALQQQKHVLLEKPFVTTVAEGEELIALAEQQDRLLTVYQNRRWDSDFLTLKMLIESGKLGEIRYFSSHFDRFRPNKRDRWRELPGAGTGIWYDLGPHLVDQTLCLFGMPQSLTGRCLVMREGCEVVDYFNVTLHYPDKEVVLHSAPFTPEPNPRYTLQGTAGSFLKYGLDPQEPRLIDGVLPVKDSWAAETKAQYGTHYTEDAKTVIPSVLGGYQHFFIALAKAIRGEGANPVPAVEALQGIKIIEAALQSSEEGRRIDL